VIACVGDVWAMACVGDVWRMVWSTLVWEMSDEAAGSESPERRRIDSPSARRRLESPSDRRRRSAAMACSLGCSVLAVRHQFGVVVAWVLGIFGVAVMLLAIRGGLG
jgi:hypothetical protein